MAAGKSRTVTLVAIFMVAAAALGMSVALQGVTLVEWWLPALACLVVAVLPGMLLRGLARRLTGSAKGWLNVAVATALAFVVLLGAFYTLNFYGAEPSSATTCEAHVTAKSTGERRQTRRVGRHRVASGPVQTVYYITATLPDGRSKRFEVSVSEYARTRTGATIDLTVEKGMLGAPVIVNRRPHVRPHQRY